MNAVSTLLAAAGLLLSMASAAHESHATPKQKELSRNQHPWGVEGTPSRATRNIAVEMADTMRFTPGEIRVKRGETIRFVVTNSGKTMHEMVLGTEEQLRKHAELMRNHPGLEHDEPYMAHVKPGGKEEITWTFNRAGTFMYGCLVPGHWEAGMKGRIIVATR